MKVTIEQISGVLDTLEQTKRILINNGYLGLPMDFVKDFIQAQAEEIKRLSGNEN